MTDASVSLFNVHSDYDFPYVIPAREDVTEKLVRILDYLEGATADGIADAATGERVTDMRRIPARFVFTQGDFRPYSYEWGVTYSGMLQAARATGNGAFADYVARRMELLAQLLPVADARLRKDAAWESPVNEIVRPRVLDHCGALCAAMMRSGQSETLKPYTDRILHFITDELYRLPDGTVARNQPYENILWLDDLYMSVPALCEAYRTTGDEKYADDAVRQIVQFARRMQLAGPGLFMHSWVESMTPHPALCWGRANGWATLAMCDLLDVLPEEHPGRRKCWKSSAPIAQGFSPASRAKGFGTSCSTATTPTSNRRQQRCSSTASPAASTGDGSTPKPTAPQRCWDGTHWERRSTTSGRSRTSAWVRESATNRPTTTTATCIPTPPTATAPS